MTDKNKIANSTAAIVETREVHAGWTKMLVASIQMSDGHTFKREIEDHGEAVCVLPYHLGRKTAVLVRQMRAPVLYASKEQQTLEAIAGGIEDKDAATCVHREAMEEAQLTLDSLEHLFTAWTMPGISTELMHFYLATYSGDARAEVSGGVDEDEDTLAVEIGLADLARMADGNRLADSKTLVLLQTLRLRRPDLF
ncbi:MAG TPA: NUDIX hydrolase [Xanthobacteraceae bacterium]|jgi:nudix-type nucleoside diphosphatase (YffH/AdpP family)|nr:NUDIX hydrolase [Xanthobacteraceae bacterium]